MAEIEIDITVLIIIAVIALAVLWYLVQSRKFNLGDIRGSIDSLLQFTRAPTVPTIRITTRNGPAHFELGRRARMRGNSLYDSYDKKTYDVTSDPTLIRVGRSAELGYITHPAGVTLSIESDVKIIKVDKFGHEMKKGSRIYDDNNRPLLKSENGEVVYQTYDQTFYAPIKASFEGTAGTLSGIDDQNESMAYQREGGWVTPFIVGLIVGVIFLSPVFAWLMSMASGA